VSGSTDGSVRLWEWGVGQPLCAPRIAGQYGKVTQTRFSSLGAKLAITDADGTLCIWHTSNSNVTDLKRPYYVRRPRRV